MAKIPFIKKFQGLFVLLSLVASDTKKRCLPISDTLHDSFPKYAFFDFGNWPESISCLHVILSKPNGPAFYCPFTKAHSASSECAKISIDYEKVMDEAEKNCRTLKSTTL